MKKNDVIVEGNEGGNASGGAPTRLEKHYSTETESSEDEAPPAHGAGGGMIKMNFMGGGGGA